MVASLENLCLDRIFKHCDIKEKKEEVSLFCYLREFLWCIYQKFFWLCECPTWNAFSKSQNFCDFCFFDKDMLGYSYFLNEIDRKTKIRKIYFVFKLFFRISDYWNHGNKNVVDEYFNLFEPNNHDVC